MSEKIKAVLNITYFLEDIITDLEIRLKQTEQLVVRLIKRLKMTEKQLKEKIIIQQKKKLIKGRVVIIFTEGNTKTLELYYKELFELEIFKKIIERCPNIREVRY